MNNNNRSLNNNNGDAKPVTPNRTVASCYNNGSTQIPLPKTLNKGNSVPGNIGILEGWKRKYEESERKRRNLLTQSEKSTRELNDLKKKYDRLADQNTCILKQLSDKQDQFEKLKYASKEFYREYDTLKCKYVEETGAYRKAMQKTSKWYKENNKLKRKSAVLVQRMLEINPDQSIDDFKDVVDNPDDSQSDSETEQLRETIKELSDKIGRLQAELNAAKLMEFEATEQTVNLTQELEQEKASRQLFEAELKKFKDENEHMSRVSKLVAQEVVHLRDTAQRDRENAVILREEANSARKERNVLAHQSALLMGDIMTSDNEDKCIHLLQEIEELKSNLEDERNKHAQEIFELQEKLEQREAEVQLEITEEKLKLVECELQVALDRAEMAEKEIEKFRTVPVTLLAPPPPPPPPPPPGLLSLSPQGIKLKTSTNVVSDSPVSDMEKLLGIEQNKKPIPAPVPAIDDIINQIKGGRFTLKARDKVEQKKAPEEPPAVKEMLNVLGTLRRRPKPMATLTECAFGDVQL